MHTYLVPRKSFSSAPFLSPFACKGDLQESHLVTFWHSVLGKAASESHSAPLEPRDTFMKFSVSYYCAAVDRASKSSVKSKTLKTNWKQPMKTSDSISYETLKFVLHIKVKLLKKQKQFLQAERVLRTSLLQTVSQF